MNTKAMALMAAVTCLVASGVLQAVEQSPQPQRTVAEVHPRLAIGALTFAKVTELPENVVLRAGSVQLRADEINRIVAAQPTQLQEDLRKNAYLVLEKQATSDILLAMAKKAQPAPGPESSKQEDRAIIQGYLQDAVLNKVQVTETDIKQLYEAEKAMLGGATLDQMYASLKQYLLNQKRQEAIRDFIRDLGKKTDIAVSQSWLASQAVLARDNPVDKARDSGKPSLVDFGATGCGPCDMMTPILEDLKVKYQGRLNVLFVHVRERQILGAKYGIQTIPVQVFFDKDGNEVFRHIGFFPQAEIEKRLAEMGATQ
jgi:thiol-disulfide isomerase/thioredoxin